MKIKYLLLTVLFANLIFILDVTLTDTGRAATFTVNNAGDSGAGSLRETIAAAAAGDTIVFSAALSGQTITLTNGQLTLTNNLTIDASSLPGGITISGNHSSRIFEIGPGARVALDSLTLSDGVAPNGEYPTNSGGSILNYGRLTLETCTLQDNRATNGFASAGSPCGGAIENYAATLDANHCLFTNNFAAAQGTFHSYGGGIDSEYSAMLTIENSIFTDNSALSGVGGGVDNWSATVVISNCLFTGNSATYGYGGGIYNGGNATLNQVTLSGNNAGIYGGAIENRDALTLNNCTLASNTASGGGAIDNNAPLLAIQCTFSENTTGSSPGSAIWAGGSNVLINCTLAGNFGGASINQYEGAPILMTNTIGVVVGSFSGANNVTNADPGLAPLGNYGGPTETMPPLTGSPAIDAGDDSVTSFLASDQRGYPRKFGAHVDIGAVELQGVIAGNAPWLMNPTPQGGGSLTFDFTNIADAEFTVLASTNLALPLSQWTGLGLATQSLPGQYQFTDPNAANDPQRFYQVVSP